MSYTHIKWEASPTHISLISVGDTIYYHESLMTVCKNDIAYCPFMGLSLFGDTYRGGRKPVIKAIIYKAMPPVKDV